MNLSQFSYNRFFKCCAVFRRGNRTILFLKSTKTQKIADRRRSRCAVRGVIRNTSVSFLVIAAAIDEIRVSFFAPSSVVGWLTI